MERRKGDTSRSSPLPLDYLKMVTEVFTTNFDENLQALQKISSGKLSFEAQGEIFPDELVLCVSLLEEDQLAATSAYASVEFDPKASSPTIQELLSACVDALGALYGQLLDLEHPDRLEQVASHSLSAMENIPFYWTEVKLDRYRIHLKVDKSNPKLDSQADEWLRKNDPELKRLEEMDQEETEKLFVTGPGGPSKKKPTHLH